jgi:hypothetical protein
MTGAELSHRWRLRHRSKLPWEDDNAIEGFYLWAELPEALRVR